MVGNEFRHWQDDFVQSETNCNVVSPYNNSNFESIINKIFNVFHDGRSLDLIKF